MRLDKGSSDWRRILRDLKQMTGSLGLTAQGIRYAVESMIANGKIPKYPMQVTYRSFTGDTWYNMAQPQVPPIWDTYNFSRWKRGELPPRLG